MDEMKDYTSDLSAISRFDLDWSLLSGKNILITGATGLVGGCVTDVLMSRNGIDYQVFAAGRDIERARKRFSSYAGNPHFHIVKFDNTQPFKAENDFHYIIHAAGGATPKLYATDPVGVIHSHIDGVDTLLKYGTTHHLERFVYVSSGEIYGEGDGRVFTEDYSGYVDCASVRACYPSAKRLAETLCVSYCHQFDLDISIARPCHVLGPHFTDSDNRVYAQLIRDVLRGNDVLLKSSGSQFRSWIYSVDCAFALLHIMFRGKKGTAYNVANAHSNITIRHLAELIAAIGGRKVVFDIPDDGTRGNTTPITKAVFDTSRLEETGWQPLFSIETALQHTIDETRKTIQAE